MRLAEWLTEKHTSYVFTSWHATAQRRR